LVESHYADLHLLGIRKVIETLLNRLNSLHKESVHDCRGANVDAEYEGMLEWWDTGPVVGKDILVRSVPVLWIVVEICPESKLIDRAEMLWRHDVQILAKGAFRFLTVLCEFAEATNVGLTHSASKRADYVVLLLLAFRLLTWWRPQVNHRQLAVQALLCIVVLVLAHLCQRVRHDAERYGLVLQLLFSWRGQVRRADVPRTGLPLVNLIKRDACTRRKHFRLWLRGKSLRRVAPHT
jgi:hypothetical protein